MTTRYTAYDSKMAGMIQLRAKITLFVVLHSASTAAQVKFGFARVNTTAILRCDRKSKAVAAASDHQRKSIKKSVGIPTVVIASTKMKMSKRLLCRLSDTSHSTNSSTHNKADQMRLMRSVRMNTVARVLRKTAKGPMPRKEWLSVQMKVDKSKIREEDCQQEKSRQNSCAAGR